MVKREPSKPKITVSIKITEDIWTKFRHICIDNDDKYGPRLERIIEEYITQSNNKKEE